MHYLHDEMNIVHRDIKLENFLMYNQNGRNKIILIDFGFATYARNDDEMALKLGTPQYAAPEIFNEKFHILIKLICGVVVLFYIM